MADLLNLLPLPLDIKVVRGTMRRWQHTFQRRNASGGLEAVDISGCTVRLTVKADKSGTAEVLYTIDAALTAPTAGVATFTVPPSAVFGDAAEVSSYFYEVRLIDGASEPTVWWAGNFLVYPTPAPVS